ncbi:MAG TPA: lysophospholipid acyltransferase family protein [Vicinamibacterales bacterium]|nr:lysophospholipid acyltransferase family protein [Vicinamibacterales bacterium]
MPARTVSPRWRWAIGLFVRAGLRTYFRRIEHFRIERAPAAGPVLFVSNHPGSITDAFIISASVPRPVHFLATVRLFRFAPLGALLTTCGVSPVNRRQDDPKAMATVADTFARCYDVFEAGGAIGIFPEGISYNDDQLKPIKTGAARMALEIEDRHDGRLGLMIAPVGLTYSAKDRFRSDALVHFGAPFRAADWLASYRANRHEGVRELSGAIERRLRELILDLPSLDHQRIVASVKQLYLDRLRLGNLIVTEPMAPGAEELMLGRAIGDALAHFEAREPERLAGFVVELMRYERRLWLLGLSDRTIGAIADGRMRRPGVARSALLAIGAPIAVYGWAHRLAPIWCIDWALDRFAPAENRRSQVAHGSMVAGLIAFGGLYLAAAALMWRLVGPTAAAIYLFSLPLTGLFAHWYLGQLAQHAGHVRSSRVLYRLPIGRRHLVRMRERLIAAIEALRSDYRRDVLGVTPPSAP